MAAQSITLAPYTITLPDATIVTVPSQTLNIGAPGILKRTKNIFDFGAAGDGSTDDSAAFNSALVYAAANATFVDIPGAPLGYALLNPISWTSTANVGSTWGFVSDGAKLLSKMSAGQDIMTLTSNHTVRYFQMIGGLSIQGSGLGDGNGLRIVGTNNTVFFYNSLISGLSVEHVGKNGVVFEGSVFESMMENCFVQDCVQDGAVWRNNAAGGIISAWNVRDCFFNQNTLNGLHLTADAGIGAPSDVRISGGYCRQNGQFGFLFENGCSDVNGVGFENNYTSLPAGSTNAAQVRAINDVRMRRCNSSGNGLGGANYLLWGFAVKKMVLDQCDNNNLVAGSQVLRPEGQNGSTYIMRDCSAGSFVAPPAGVTVQEVV